MYRKILVPLEESRDAEKVFPRVLEELAPEGEVILLQVALSAQDSTMGGHLERGRQHEEAERAKLGASCSLVLGKLGINAKRRRCEVVVATSVPQGIADFARREGVDLIAIHTFGNPQLAAQVQRSLSRASSGGPAIAVQLFRPREAAGVT